MRGEIKENYKKFQCHEMRFRAVEVLCGRQLEIERWGIDQERVVGVAGISQASWAGRSPQSSS